MARGGINKAVVKKARQAILARGEHPSIDAVRIEMGNTGSKTTIHRYLKELDDGASGVTAALRPWTKNWANWWGAWRNVCRSRPRNPWSKPSPTSKNRSRCWNTR